MSLAFDIVDKANRHFEQLFNGDQLDQLVELYTENGRLFPPDKNKYEGREQIKQFWQSARAAGVDQLRLTTGTVEQAGNDCLIETSSYQHALDRGNYQVIWKRDGEKSDQWKLHIDIFN